MLDALHNETNNQRSAEQKERRLEKIEAVFKLLILVGALVVGATALVSDWYEVTDLKTGISVKYSFLGIYTRNFSSTYIQ